MKLQSDVDYLDPENNDRAEFEDHYIISFVPLGYVLEKYFLRQSHHSRLPNMKLPEFNGKYSNFMSFFLELGPQ